MHCSRETDVAAWPQASPLVSIGVAADGRSGGRDAVKELAQFVMLLVRGLLLWVVVPLAVVSWVALGPITTASLGACIGWFDLNLFVVLQRVVVRPLTREAASAWVPLGKMRTTEHRVSILDPW